jgi:23S rRNA (guanine745-N1)-methyltransferase
VGRYNYQYKNLLSYNSVMNVVPALNLVCPLDGEILQLSDKQLICCSGHSFDIAHEGYVNLLPVQFKKTKNPGDSKQMVVARRQFLNAGYYAPIAKHLCSYIVQYINTNPNLCVLDAGCGEGYYLEQILRNDSVQTVQAEMSLIGLDISKWAIIKAAKRNNRICWIVGSNKSPPVVHGSVDIVICAFGFCNLEVFSQVLKSGGMLILINPASKHLIELRNIIYSKVNETVSKFNCPSNFKPVDERKLVFRTLELPNDQIQNLLLMTPHLFRASYDGKQKLARLDKLSLSVDVRFLVFEKIK